MLGKGLLFPGRLSTLPVTHILPVPEETKLGGCNTTVHGRQMAQTWLIYLRNFIAQSLPSLDGRSFGKQPFGTETEALG